jgi:glycosidase
MKKISIYIALFFIAFSFSCNQQTKDDTSVDLENEKYPGKARSMNIYEVNIRQYTPEGTINAFNAHLPRLKEMGVDILWIMPIQPIGVKNRKGLLGSYYSIQDYTAVNPEFGTLDDFKSMVDKAHELGMIVILDWVANHSAWDHEWITNHPEYYTKDSLGNIVPPVPDWSDVADLNYDNVEFNQVMIDEMKWWVVETDIDGYRCDVAGEVPMSFWNNAKDQLDQIKDLFMLAEWDEPRMHDHAFHMSYGWGPHHWMNETAKGHIDADSLETLFSGDIERYGNAPYRMIFTTNHDENSWNGTVFERFGAGHLAWAAFAFTVRGMPLIYGGQEAGLNKRLRFFDKDTIDFTQIPHAEFYSKLLALKHDNEALFNGEYGGELQFVNDNNNMVTSYTRTKGDNQLIAIINLSDQSQEVTYSDPTFNGEFKDFLTGQQLNIKSGEKLTLQPYEYYIVSK